MFPFTGTHSKGPGDKVAGLPARLDGAVGFRAQGYVHQRLRRVLARRRRAGPHRPGDLNRRGRILTGSPYHFAGCQHGPGEVPPLEVRTDDGIKGQPPINSVNCPPLLRAPLDDLNRWGTTGDPGLGGQRELQDWAVSGSPQDRAEIINRCHEEDGLNYIGLASLNLPSDFSARLDYLQLISEELIPRLQRRGQSRRRRATGKGKIPALPGAWFAGNWVAKLLCQDR